jgi:dihydroorotase
MILIKNGYIIDPASGFEDYADIVIEDGIIKKIGCLDGDYDNAASQNNNQSNSNNKNNKTSDSNYEQVIDAKGMIIAPGLVDTHVHFRDPGFTYKEDIETGAQAAAAGGFTTVMCMANTKPVIDNVETLKYVLEKGKKTPVNVYSAAAVSKGFKGEELTDFKSLKEAGAYVFTDDGIPLKDELLVKKAMEEAKKLDMPLSFHEENTAFIEQQGINKGAISDKLGLGGAPALSEYIMVARDCMLALETGATICIQHISSAVSVELVRTAKRLGADVHAEATPQHFSLTEDIVLEKGTLARVNPPIRTEEDRQAIIKALADGTIDIIATDHAPHSSEEKAKEFKAAPSGMIGLETSLALGVTNLVKTGKLTMKELLSKMTINPAKLYKMDKGYIKEGGAADIVIYAPDEKWVVSENFASKAANSPFIGDELYGKIKYTIYNGNVVYSDANKKVAE